MLTPAAMVATALKLRKLKVMVEELVAMLAEQPESAVMAMVTPTRPKAMEGSCHTMVERWWRR